MRDLSSSSHGSLSHSRDPVLMRLPLLVAIVLVVGLIAAGFYSARPLARTDVPSIELPAARERARAERDPPGRVKSEPTARETRNGGSGGGDGSSGATPIPAPPPTPAGGSDDDDDDDDADGDDGDDASDDSDD